MAKKTANAKRPAPLFETLEPRLLLSAEGLGTMVAEAGLDDDLELPQSPAEIALLQVDDSAQAERAAVSQSRELVFVDPRTPDYQALVDDLLSQAGQGRNIDVVVLDVTQNGVAQVTETLADYEGLDAVHLVSHGGAGGVQLGGSTLGFDTLLANAGAIQGWGTALGTEADILIYGCDLAATEDGRALVDSLSRLTGADVAASDDLTGHSALGADWELEHRVGVVGTEIALSQAVRESWFGKLSVDFWLSTDNDVGAPGADGLLGGWTEGDILTFGGPDLTFGAPTDGDLSLVIGLDSFADPLFDDGSVDTGALHFVSRDMTVGGGGNTFALQSGDLLVSFLQDETILAAYTSSGLDTLFDDQDLLVFRPDTPGNYSSGTFHLLLDDVVPVDLKGVSLIEEDTTVGGTPLTAGSFLIIQEVSATTSIDVFTPTGVGQGATTGTTTPLIDLTGVSIAPDSLRGIELIESALTIGGQALPAGSLLATLNTDNAGLGINRQDVFVLNLTSTGLGSTAGSTSMFLRGIDVNLDTPQESAYALALAANLAPMADVGGSYTIAEGDSLNLDGSSSSDPDLDTLTYAWDLDNDGVFGEPGEPTTASPTVLWATLQSFGIDDDAASYTIGVRVDDGNGATDTDTATLTVGNTAPTLTVTGATTVNAGGLYTLTLGATDPGDDTITAWTVNWGDGTIQTVPGNPGSATHTYASAGFTYNITASAQDEDGTFYDSALLVANAASGSDGFVVRYPYDPATGTADVANRQVLNTTIPADLDWAGDVIVGPDGYVYVTGYDSGNIVRFNASTWVHDNSFVITPATNPVSIDFGPDGYLYVVSDARTVTSYDVSSPAAPVSSWSLSYTPEEAAFGPDGRFYVGDYISAGRIYRHDLSDPDWTDDALFANPPDAPSTRTEQFAFGPGEDLYVVRMNGDILRYDGATGLPVGTGIFASTPPAGGGWPNGPTSLAFGPDGDLYVTNVNRVERFDGSTGAALPDFVVTGTNGLSNPWFSTFTPAHQVTITDTPGISVTPIAGLTTTEAGGTASFDVVLDSAPTANVTIAIVSSDTGEGTVSTGSLTFTPGNWSTAQTVTVTGVDDTIADGNIAYTITTGAAASTDPGYNGLNAADIAVTNSDDDTAGISVTPIAGLTTTEAGGTASLDVVLDSAPTANVTIAIVSSDTGEGTVSTGSLTFTPSNWSTAQTVTVTGVDDAIADGNTAYSIVTAAAASADGSYNGLNANDVAVTNTDDDVPGNVAPPPVEPPPVIEPPPVAEPPPVFEPEPPTDKGEPDEDAPEADTGSPAGGGTAQPNTPAESSPAFGEAQSPAALTGVDELRYGDRDRTRPALVDRPDLYDGPPPVQLPQVVAAAEEIKLPEMQQPALWGALDMMAQQMNDAEEWREQERERQVMLQATTGVAFTLSAGFVTWMLRAGTLATSLLSSMPLWRGFDPLPVVGLAAREHKRLRAANVRLQADEAQDDPDVGRLFDRASEPGSKAKKKARHKTLLKGGRRAAPVPSR